MSRYGHDDSPEEMFNEVGKQSAEPAAHEISEGRGHVGNREAPHQPSARDIPSIGKDQEIAHARRFKHLDPDRERSYALRDSELRTLTDIGTFRVLRRDDLVMHRYGGDAALAHRDFDNLSRQKLILQRTTFPEKAVYVTLTKPAQRFVESQKPQNSNSKQEFYHGFVKPREARHDAAIYRLYQQESGRIERTGGRIQRVILDFELKRSVNKKFARLQSLPASEQAAGKRQIAAEHGLPIVNGKIALPDLRLEYEGPNQEPGRVDLELVTGDYHSKGLRAKAQTGFTMYGLPEDAARLRPAMTDPEIMLNILSL